MQVIDFSRLAQWQSTRLLIARFLVRVQDWELNSLTHKGNGHDYNQDYALSTAIDI